MISGTGNRSPRGGFTLIELILVMALLVVILGLAAPMLGGTTRAAIVAGEARRIAASLERARAEALARGIPVRAWLDPAARRAGWEPRPGFEDDAAGAAPLRLRDDVGFTVDGSDGAADSGGVALAEFDAAGDVVGGRAASVTVSHARGESATVRLDRDGWSFAVTEAAP